MVEAFSYFAIPLAMHENKERLHKMPGILSCLCSIIEELFMLFMKCKLALNA